MEYTLEQEKQYFDKLKASLTQNGKLLYAGRLLQRAAQNYPNSLAILYKDQEISYRQLYERASAFTKLLKQKGIKPRDKVIICFENSPEFYIAYYAAWQAGAVVAPINTFLVERELTHIVNDAQPKMIISSSDRVDVFKKAASSIEVLTPADMPSKLEGAADDSIDLDPEELCALLYTSGTTGLPKGVMLSSKNIITNLMQGVSRLQMGHGERLFGVLPLFHVFAQNVFIWGAIFMAATVILVSKIDRKLILEALKYEPTIFLGVPALFGLLCLLRTAPLDSVKYFVSGGDALPDKIRSYFELLYRRKLCNGYGLTETSPVIAVDFTDTAKPTNLVGRPVLGLEIQLRGEEDGKPVPHGQIGELWVKGDNVMMGYYNAPEQTEKVLKDGWLNTGDVFYLDEDGKLVVTGRTKDIIKNKGINIYPQEIENVISSYPNVLAVGVVGKADENGETPVAFVQLRQEEPGIENTLMELCKQQLAAYKVPRQFICSIEELPMTSTRKINKKLLREQLNKHQ